MNISQCALCLHTSELRKSHIIPNSVFRRIKQRQGSGQLIRFDDWQHTSVDRSQDSWWEYLLCAACEQIISDNEKYGLNLLRNAEWPSPSVPKKRIILKNHDYVRFKIFLNSILWRAAISKQPIFARAHLPPLLAEEARSSILLGKALRPLRLGCKLFRLIDSKKTEHGPFSTTDPSHLVTSPIPRLSENKAWYSILFLLEGFLLEFFVQAIPFRDANADGVHRDAPTIFVPLKCIFTVPELVSLMGAGHAKHLRGQVSFQ